MLYLIVYLYDTYGSLLNFIHILIPVSSIVLSVSILGFYMLLDFLYIPFENFKIKEQTHLGVLTFYKTIKISFTVLIGVLFLSIVMPSKQGLAMLAGVYIGNQVYEHLNQSVLVDKSIKLLDLELNNYLDEMIAEKTKKLEKSEPKESK